MKSFVFLQIKQGVEYPNGLYNGRYNSESALITIADGKPSYVQFTNNSSIFKPSGILLSSTEILVEQQNINL